MTQHPHDQLSKQLLEELLPPLGEVQRSLEIPGEAKFVDLWFAPYSDVSPPRAPIDLLQRIAQSRCLLEPFRNSPQRSEVRSCLLKLLWVQEDLRRQAERNKQPLEENSLPLLWIIGTSISKPILEEFGATSQSDFGQGIYSSAPGLRMNFIAINELSQTRETLILRLLGRGRTQQEAVKEVFELSSDDPQRSLMLRVLSSWKFTLELGEFKFDERESIMALSQAFLEWEQTTKQESLKQGLEQGLEQGEKTLILRQLNRKFGSITPKIIAKIQALPLGKIEVLGENLLDFGRLEDLQEWLNEN